MSKEYRGRYGSSLGLGDGSKGLFNYLSSVSERQQFKGSIELVPKVCCKLVIQNLAVMFSMELVSFIALWGPPSNPPKPIEPMGGIKYT